MGQQRFRGLPVSCAYAVQAKHPPPPPPPPQFNDPGFDLLAWYRGTDGTWQNLARTVSALDGQVVRAWDDISGNNYHVSRNSANIGRVAGGTKGLVQSYIHNKFSGTADRFVISSANSADLDWTLNTARTFFMRYSVNSAAAYNFVVAKEQGSIVDWTIYTAPSAGGNHNVDLYEYAGPKRILRWYPGLVVNTAYELWVRVDNSNTAVGIQLRLQRAEVTESTSASTPLTVLNNSGLFTLLGGTANGNSNDVAVEEIAIFDRLLTVPEIAAFEAGYLTTRYGVP